MKFRHSVVRNAGLGFALCPLMIGTGVAQTAAPVDLTGTSLEDLMNIQVTSVSKKEEPLSKAASAIFVITQDDIRHSGATNVPDLLRMVPGVEVARINANTWAISIRGFNNRYSAKVLVLIDGRTVYTPGDSGVYWDQQTMPLENIDRIEVIRGAGGTVWGANAMNGVINVITKSANDTQGGLISAETGSQDRAQGLVQYGGSAGTIGSYRIYGRYTANENSPSLPGSPAVDDGHSSQLGFRSDWNLSSQDKLTVQGDFLGLSEGQTITTLFENQLPDYHILNEQVQVATENMLGRWNHVFANGSEATAQVYYDRFRRVDQALNIVNTGDVDLQYHFHAGARNDIVAGLGYRVTDQSYTDGFEITFGTGHRRDNLFSSFIQDEFRLTDSVSLTVGSKFEHNAYTGFEYEPSVQLIWSPSSRQSVWASVSRAIQQPSWLYAEAQLDAAVVPLPGGNFAIAQVNGNLQGTAPIVFDYELGYRTELAKRLTLDATVFLGEYYRLETIDPVTPFFTSNPAPPHLVLPSVYGNLGNGRNYGGEISAHWDVTRWWRISPGFSFLQMALSADPGVTNATFVDATGNSPKRQAQLRSNIKLPHKMEWDTSVYYVGSLGIGSTGTPPVAAYTRVDTRIGWHMGESVDIGITGQNLLTARHVEFLDGLQVTPMETARAVVAKVTWHF
jgi:iron complex outermembrane receptor protein